MKFERHHEILKRLSKFGSVKVSDLSNSLNVTKETIRSDLNELARLGYLTRCHGGAFIVLDSLVFAVQADLDGKHTVFLFRIEVTMVLLNDTIYIF